MDIDKTLCEKGKNDKYSDAKPIKKVCEALIKANSEGVYIILFTSRNMRTFKGSLGLINKITAPIILKWLADNEIPYDEIYFGKPWGIQFPILMIKIYLLRILFKLMGNLIY